MKTIDEITSAALELSAEERFKLARNLMESDPVREMQRRELVEAIMVGLRQSERGEVIDGEVAFARARQAIEEARRSR